MKSSVIPIYHTGKSGVAVGEGLVEPGELPTPTALHPTAPPPQEFGVKTPAPSHLFMLAFALGGIVYMKKDVKKQL